MNHRFLLASLAYLCAFLPLAGAQSTQCSNGVDDDGDGGIDALIELPEYNGVMYTLAGPGGIGSSHTVRVTVERMISEKRMQLTLPTEGAGSSIVRSDNANWDYAGTFDTGTPYLPTLQKVCRILGYRDYVASTCRDDERSWRYPHGKCNYHSPENNYLWRFAGTDFVRESAKPKMGKTWIATITCQHKLAACNDGWDNDGDGRIDLQDPDCQSKNDNSERPKDPKCKSPSGQTEFEQCRNSIDDDHDGATDAADSGCWRMPGVPSSYDPSLDDEGRGVAQCKDGVDNDGDGATDTADFSCSSPDDNDESYPKAQCQDGVDNDHDGKVDLADSGCASTQDNDEHDAKTQCSDGIDNDCDGASDLADFSCSNAWDDDESYPKSQCQDGLDNDADGLTDLSDSGCSDGQDNDECNDVQTVTLGLDCVHNNRDGTYTAYFGYEYFGQNKLEVVTNAKLGTQNDISPAPAWRGQVTTFYPGRHPGASAILFDGSPTTWTVRTQGGGLSSVSASKSSPSCKPITPRAECVQDSGKVVFGYSNPNPFSVRINVGFLNSVYPAPVSGTQPVTFLSGLHPSVFTTTLKESAEWSLDGSVAKVTSSTPGCGPSGCSTHDTGALRDSIVYAAVQMGEITKQALYVAHGSGGMGRASRAKAGAARRASAQIQRASSRADDLVQKVIRLSSSIPALMYSCTSSAASCRTIDRGETLRALANVYSLQLKQLSKLMLVKKARSASVRSKLVALVSKAKALKAQGEGSLAQCPRFDKKCR